MIRLLFDESVQGDILRGLRAHRPSMEVERVQDVGLRTAEDPLILEWAAAKNYIVATHDASTMPDYAYERVAAGQPMPGLMVIPQDMPVGEAIEELTIIDECSSHAEWADRVAWLPI